MKETVSKKKDYIIPAILSIFVVILSTAVFLQERQLSKFTEGLGEKSRTEIKADSRFFEENVSQGDEELYQTKIERLETKIVEMQELQDHLEDTLNKYSEKDDSAVSIQPEMDAVSKAKENFYIRRSFLKRHDDFLEQNNYPPELNEKLFDLFVERNVTLDEFKTNAQKTGFGNIKGDSNEAERRIDEINAEYDEKIAELLSEDGLALLKEYENRNMERSLIMHFNDMLVDETLDKERERELIESMYKGRQPYMPYDPFDVAPESGPMRETLDAYVDSAEGILSESQTVKFKAFINSLKKLVVPDNTAENNSDKE